MGSPTVGTERHPILSTGLMWTTASDLARFNLAFTKALNSGHSLIDQPLAKQLSNSICSEEVCERFQIFIAVVAGKHRH